jgi:hypothetical protein
VRVEDQSLRQIYAMSTVTMGCLTLPKVVLNWDQAKESLFQTVGLGYAGIQFWNLPNTLAMGKVILSKVCHSANVHQYKLKELTLSKVILFWDQD